jgi:hypothetical protein
MREHNYWVRFTNGHNRLSMGIAEPDLVFAVVKARQYALDIMQYWRSRSDWKNWRIIIETPDEGRIDEPFPI